MARIKIEGRALRHSDFIVAMNGDHDYAKGSVVRIDYAGDHNGNKAWTVSLATAKPAKGEGKIHKVTIWDDDTLEVDR